MSFHFKPLASRPARARHCSSAAVIFRERRHVVDRPAVNLTAKVVGCRILVRESESSCPIDRARSAACTSMRRSTWRGAIHQSEAGINLPARWCRTGRVRSAYDHRSRVSYRAATAATSDGSGESAGVTVGVLRRRTTAITPSRRKIFQCQNAPLRDWGASLGSPPDLIDNRGGNIRKFTMVAYMANT